MGAALATTPAREEESEDYRYHMTLPYAGADEHPEGYDGPCGCHTCLSYGAQDHDAPEGT